MVLPAPASPVASKKGNDLCALRIWLAYSEPNQNVSAIMPWVPKHIHSHTSQSLRCWCRC
ncbi:hypothetical protein D3C71_2092490 [compost metagenome]